MSTRYRRGRVRQPRTPRPGDPPTSRRRVLAVGAALALAAPAGCGLFDDEPQPRPGPDPLQPILDEALALAAAHERAAAADPSLAARLAPLAQDHRAHAAELTRVIGPLSGPVTGTVSGSPAPGTSAGPVAQTVAELRRAEQAAARTATAAARTAPAARAGLVGSIAACRATHAEALR